VGFVIQSWGFAPRNMVDNLSKIEHIVVLMLENRSFDHMLGYLRLEAHRNDIDGLTGEEVNLHGGATFKTRHLDKTVFPHDPCHRSECVRNQLADNNGGFVRDFAKVDPNDPGSIMGYYNASDLPVYNHLAQEFCVCDRWFCCVRGETWPNRLYPLAGNSNGEANNPAIWSPRCKFICYRPWPMLPWLCLPWFRLTLEVHLPSYAMPTVFDHLTEANVEWSYYSHDIAFLRLFEKYRLDIDSIHKVEEFLEHAQAGILPSVSWIDPNFGDFKVRLQPPNDDHPPADIRRGQTLVAQIYNALLKGGNDLWRKSLFIIVYDEHGGFYDHVIPQERPADDRPEFQFYGVRVPAFVISPWVGRGTVSHTVFDHTCILKTILQRFCTSAGKIPDMGARVTAANDLGPLLSEEVARTDATPVPEIEPLSMMATAPLEQTFRTDHKELLAALRDECVTKGVPPNRL
jgi:phospholipase C